MAATWPRLSVYAWFLGNHHPVELTVRVQDAAHGNHA